MIRNICLTLSLVMMLNMFSVNAQPKPDETETLSVKEFPLNALIFKEKRHIKLTTDLACFDLFDYSVISDFVTTAEAECQERITQRLQICDDALDSFKTKCAVLLDEKAKEIDKLNLDIKLLGDQIIEIKKKGKEDLRTWKWIAGGTSFVAVGILVLTLVK